MDFVNLEFADEKMRKIQQVLPAVRSSRANVHINGPTGSGKSSLAKHILSPIDYSVMDLIAVKENFDFLSLFENSSVNAFLFENIDSLNMNSQKNLSEALESITVKERFRVLSTSRNSLKSLVQKGYFREDLYYRLTVLNLEIPALGHRSNDVEILAQHLVGVFGIIHQKSDVLLSQEALEKMKTWSWPGNIRELENVLERAVILSHHGLIQTTHIEFETEGASQSSKPGFTGMTLSQVEQKLILQTLELTEQNRTRAAEILGISIRTLRNKINEYRQAGLV